jgi:hypothetical protein
MDIKQLAEQLADSNAEAIAAAGARVRANGLSKSERSQIWEGTIAAAINKPNSKIVDLGMELSDMKMDPEARDMYESLFTMCAFAKSPSAYAPTIRTGAAVARLTSGAVPDGLNAEAYLALARQAFIKVLDQGSEDTKKYAIEALRHIKDHGVQKILTQIARMSEIEILRSAAGDSMGYIRCGEELERAKADRQFLLETEYQDTTSPQVIYIDTIYAAVEFVLNMKRGDREDMGISVSLMQLVSFAEKPPQVEALFPSRNDKDNIGRMGRSVENALLHVLTTASPELKAKAAEGLVHMGSERVEGILEAIIQREGQAGDTGKAAYAALSRIWADQSEIFALPSLRPQPAAGKAVAGSGLRKLTR